MELPAKVDREAYRDYYANAGSKLPTGSRADFTAAYEQRRAFPRHLGGTYRGFARSVAISRLLSAAARTGKDREALRIVDVGSGNGELSAYLACRGFHVHGIDVSTSGCEVGRRLARSLGVEPRCRFLAESIERTSLPDRSVDFIIGFGALHHFIKYEGVPKEMLRIMKPGAAAFFVDGFGENPLYRIFQDAEKMRRLGDVILSRKLIYDYFGEAFDVELVPTDWFSMFSKLVRKTCGKDCVPLAQLLFALDRKIPTNSLTLFLSGVVVTQITRRSRTGSGHLLPVRDFRIVKSRTV